MRIRWHYQYRLLARSQDCARIFPLEQIPAGTGLRYRERSEAQRQLAKLNQLEEIATKLDTVESQPPASVSMTIRFWRMRLEERYRTIIGCSYRERHELRIHLQQLLNG